MLNVTLVPGGYFDFFLSRGKRYMFAAYDKLEKKVIAYSNDPVSINKKYSEKRYEILLSSNVTNFDWY
jgi:hypothetical protein